MTSSCRTSEAARRGPAATSRAAESRGASAAKRSDGKNGLEVLERRAAQVGVVGLEGPRRDPGGLPLEREGQEGQHVLAQELGVVRGRELARGRGQGRVSRHGELRVLVGQREKGAGAAPAELERRKVEAGDQAVAGQGRGAGLQDGGHAAPHLLGHRGIEERVHELAGRARPEGRERGDRLRAGGPVARGGG